MEKESAIAQGQHNLSGKYIFDRASRDFDHVSRPETRQHALATHTQPQIAACAQTSGRE
ncbi:MAG TPA: hypothetical protein VMI10_18435 [Terriglobales bacterium]|nr:hypothetical protein [Terriglobales bacterium]